MRAADGGYAPRFLSLFLALGFSRFDCESTLPPTAANADRSAAVLHNKVRQIIGKQAFPFSLLQL